MPYLVACVQTSPRSLRKNREKRKEKSLFSQFFLREGGRLYTGYTLASVRNKSESLTYHIIVPITVTLVTSTECRVKTYKFFNIFFLSR